MLESVIRDNRLEFDNIQTHILCPIRDSCRRRSMPELPDVVIYLESLERFVGQREIQRIDLRSPFVVRSIEPDLFEAQGKTVIGFRRLGKRIVWELSDDLFLVVHLMIAGRFHWKKPNTRPTRKVDLAAFQFENGTLMLTEASSKKRAGLWLVRGEAGLAEHQPGGLEILDCDEATFRTTLTSKNHTLKRALTNPKIFSGIGNAYSDEILHAACLSPIKWTSRLSEDEISRLFQSVQATMQEWIEVLREQVGDGFPKKVTAFHPKMAVHGRFGKPCPRCQAVVQRIVYAENETNYCPACQTEGKILADRSLSRLLKDDWPRSIEELES